MAYRIWHPPGSTGSREYLTSTVVIAGPPRNLLQRLGLHPAKGDFKPLAGIFHKMKETPMCGIGLEKAAMRERAFAARKAARGQGADDPARAALEEFLNGLPAFEVISGYMPIRTEINPVPVMKALYRVGKTICVPVIEAAGLPLKFSRWSPETKMLRGPFGAAIPETDDFIEPDVLITPLAAFDKRGYRLGYGGGYYDRSFARLRALKPVVTVGFAYGAQEVAKVPTEPTDQRLDALVTENGVLRF